ncbi:MAG: hypothetical protein K2H22_06175 [Muribaculaceae bacterium]|nr:hypothetical protein [Muribaculaceae bacterium]
MKKSGFTFLLLLTGIIPAMAGESDVLTPESCNVGDRPFTAPLSWIDFNFDGGITLLEGASASVECDGVTVATATDIEVSNYRGKERTQGTLLLTFEEQLLPKGKSYTVCITSGSIAREDNEKIQNSRIEQNFDVPENLGATSIYQEDGSVIATVSKSGYPGFPTFYWGIETEPVGNPYFILYREGVAVREIPAHITWDWDLGQAYAEVSGTMNFEQGVRYTLTLPAGSAHAMLRDDIVNEEVSFNFIGGYTGPIQALHYSNCIFFSERPNVLDEVTVIYESDFQLAENAVIQLWNADGSDLIKEAPAYINTMINCFGLSADFGSYELSAEKGYTLVIPEGTVIACSGDPVVNTRCTIPITGGSGIQDVPATDDRSSSIIYDLNGTKTSTPVAGRMYVRDGKIFIYK